MNPNKTVFASSFGGILNAPNAFYLKHIRASWCFKYICQKAVK